MIGFMLASNTKDELIGMKKHDPDNFIALRTQIEGL